jgi:hypothetical protein
VPVARTTRASTTRTGTRAQQDSARQVEDAAGPPWHASARPVQAWEHRQTEAASVTQVFHSDQIQYTESVTSSTGTWSVRDREYFSYEGVLTGRRATLSVTAWAPDEVVNSSPTTTRTYTTGLR